MHELSIALSILDLATEEAECRGGARVLAVHLKLGSLSGVYPNALRSAFEMAREGHLLPDAELVIVEVPVAVYCPACAAEHAIATFPELRCPVCGTATPQIVRGRELEVVALEIET